MYIYISPKTNNNYVSLNKTKLKQCVSVARLSWRKQITEHMQEWVKNAKNINNHKKYLKSKAASFLRKNC